MIKDWDMSFIREIRKDIAVAFVVTLVKDSLQVWREVAGWQLGRGRWSCKL